MSDNPTPPVPPEALALVALGDEAVRRMAVEWAALPYPTEPKTNLLLWLGARVSHHLRRAWLLGELNARGWNLARTGAALGIGSTPHVLRAIRALELVEEYDKAKAAGLERRGGRKRAARAS